MDRKPVLCIWIIVLRLGQVNTYSIWDARIIIVTFSINFIINIMTFFVIVNGYIVRRTTNIRK